MRDSDRSLPHFLFIAMKNVIINCLFLLPCTPGFAQQGLNLAQALNYPKSDFSHAITVHDTIIGYGTGFSDTVDWKQGVVLAKLDSNGNVLTTKIILDSLGDKLSVAKHWGTILPTSDGGYAMTAATVYRESAFLIKTDHNFNIEFIKEYPDTVNLSNYFYMLLETVDGYLLYGAIQRPDYYDDGFIRHVDKQGETIWFKYLTTTNYSNGVLDVKKVTDTTFVAAMVNVTYPGVSQIYPSSAASSIHYFHLDGTILDFWQSDPDPEIGYLRKIIPTADGGVLTYGLYVVEVIGVTKVVQSTLAKLDSDFNLQWVRHFGPIKSFISDNILRDFAPTPDGNYIAAGEATVKIGDEPSRRVGWLHKFTPEGDSLWSRYVDAPFPLINSNNGFFGGVGVLSSGSIVASGGANEGVEKYCWLVKVTPDGCLDTLWCQPLAAQPEPPRQQLQVYPNPATDWLQVSCAASGIAEFMLSNSIGQPVIHRRLPASEGIESVSVQHLPPGIYYWRVNTPRGPVGSGKLIVQR